MTVGSHISSPSKGLNIYRIYPNLINTCLHRKVVSIYMDTYKLRLLASRVAELEAPRQVPEAPPLSELPRRIAG